MRSHTRALKLASTRVIFYPRMFYIAGERTTSILRGFKQRAGRVTVRFRQRIDADGDAESSGEFYYSGGPADLEGNNLQNNGCCIYLTRYSMLLMGALDGDDDTFV